MRHRPLELAAAVEANNAFALALYGEVARGEGNRFFSPVSLSTALTLTLLGAAGNTEAEMRAALRLPGGDPHGAFAALQAAVVADRGTAAVVRIANRLWGQADYGFLDAFLADATRHYGAGLERLDFAASAAARATINGWVAGQTAGKIPELLPEGLLDARTRLVLTNAVYFKGLWADAFKASDTYPAPFTVAAGKTVEAKFMRRRGSYAYADNADVRVLVMPYKDAGISMVAVLPKDVAGLGATEALLAERLDGWIAEASSQKVDVRLPRFELRAKATMNAHLQALGMREAFTLGADFSRMSGKDDLYVSAVAHEAYVAVDEAGTEAAAATAVVMDVKSAAPRPIAEFRADHPFFFAIRDDRSGALLFVGRVADPTAG